MSDSRETLQVKAVKAALASCTGTGSYTHDLTGNGRIMVGLRAWGHVPEPPYVIVYSAGTPTEHGGPLGMYSPAHRIGIIACAPVSSDDPETGVYAVLDLLADIRRALEADRTLGGTCYDLIVADTPNTPSPWDEPVVGVFGDVLVQLTYQRESGNPS